jgi:hypothetical protein
MHAWMDQLFPSESTTLPIYGGVAGDPAGARPRFEPDASRLDSALTLPSATDPQRLAKAMARGDWATLAANNFLPRCTSFIVEWSFGDPHPTTPGEVLWFGLERRQGSRLAVGVYPNIPGGGDGTHRIPVLQTDDTWTNHDVTPRLVHGFTPGADQAVLTSYFGYVDPTFQPPVLEANGEIDDSGGAQPRTRSMAWAWPRLVRVTLTLADANDASIESTFQYVFAVPEE